MHSTLLRATLRTHRLTLTTSRAFSSTPNLSAKNRIYPSRIRNDDELQTLILMSSSSRTPLLTLWMTTWSRDCDEVSPIIRELLETERVGEAQGGVSFVEVEMDSPDLGGVSGVASRYLINKIPTLLAFDRSEPQIETKVHRLEDLKSEAFLRRWIETEAARHGQGGAGAKIGGLFGGLFGGR